MNVVDFPNPFVHHVQRRCRVCRDLVKVTLLAGADVVRDPYYTCPTCVPAQRPPLTLAEFEPAPQLQLEEDRG